MADPARGEDAKDASDEPDPADARTLVGALAKISQAAPPIGELPDLLKLDDSWSPERISRAVEDGISAGEIVAWPECPSGPAVMLAKHVAFRHRLRLATDDSGVMIKFRWARPGEDRNKPAKRKFHPDRRLFLEGDSLDGEFDVKYETDKFSLPGKASAKLHVGDPTDSIGRYIDAMQAYREGYVKPEYLEATIACGATFIGTSYPWVAWKDGLHPDEGDAGGKCPECRGLDLPEGILCLRCDRGMESLIPPGRPLPLDGVEDPAPEVKPVRPYTPTGGKRGRPTTKSA